MSSGRVFHSLVQVFGTKANANILFANANLTINVTKFSSLEKTFPLDSTKKLPHYSTVMINPMSVKDHPLAPENS